MGDEWGESRWSELEADSRQGRGLITFRSLPCRLPLSLPDFELLQLSFGSLEDTLEDFELRRTAAFPEQAPTSREGEPKVFGQIFHWMDHIMRCDG